MVNVSSGVMFMMAIFGYAVTHHDLLQKFPRVKTRVFLSLFGPTVALWGVWQVLGGMAESANISDFTFWLNIALGTLGAYAIGFRPFRGVNGASIPTLPRQ